MKMKGTPLRGRWRSKEEAWSTGCVWTAGGIKMSARERRLSSGPGVFGRNVRSGSPKVSTKSTKRRSDAHVWSNIGGHNRVAL